MSRHDKALMLVGGPGAGEMIRVPAGAYDWRVEVAPDPEKVKVMTYAERVEHKQYTYAISPFPIRMQGGEPLYLGVLIDGNCEATHALAAEYRRVVQENQRLAFQLKELTA